MAGMPLMGVLFPLNHWNSSRWLPNFSRRSARIPLAMFERRSVIVGSTPVSPSCGFSSCFTDCISTRMGAIPLTDMPSNVVGIISPLATAIAL